MSGEPPPPPERGALGPALIVTASVRASAATQERARRIAGDLRVPYVPREGESFDHLVAETGARRLLVVGAERVALREGADGVEYIFHPNMTPVRATRMLSGGRDLFAEATGLGPGDRLLDCTLGFAAEATLGAWLVGEAGQVVGLESVPELAAVTREGLQMFPMPIGVLASAMRRISVVTADYREFLPCCSPGAFDVVYFDPFFAERLAGAESSMNPLAYFGNPAPLDAASVLDARRVARRRVVVKHPWREPLPPVLAQEVTQVVSARKSRLAYSILPGLAQEAVVSSPPDAAVRD